MWHSSECMLYDASTICLSNMHVSFFHVHGLYLLVSSVCLCWLLLWWHSDFIHLTSLSSKFYSWMLHPQSSFISQRIVLCAGIWPFDGPLLKRVGNSRCFQIKWLVPGRSVIPWTLWSLWQRDAVTTGVRVIKSAATEHHQTQVDQKCRGKELYELYFKTLM